MNEERRWLSRARNRQPDQRKDGRGASLERMLLVSGALGVLAPRAFGYAEDVCYAYAVRRGAAEASTDQVYFYPFSCYDLTCSDGPGTRASLGASCLPQGFAEFLGATMLGTCYANSSLHYESIWLYARLAGIPAGEAELVAEASQNTDLGHWRSVESVATVKRKGGSAWIASLQAITDADADGLMDDNLEGLVRTNYATDGYWLHYVPRQCTDDEQARLGVAPEDGFVGDQALADYTRRVRSGQSPLPSCEAPLQHARAWAFSFEPTPLCKFGLVDGAGGCSDETLVLSAPIFGDVATVNGPVDLGAQETRATWDGAALAYDLDVGREMAGDPAALGVYLHMLGDRISHRACASGSFVVPSAARAQDGDQDAAYTLEYAPACGQVAHILLHEGETGEPSGVVPPRTVQGLEWMLRETFAWAESRGYTPLDPGRAASRGGADDLDLLVEQLVPRLAAAEAEPCANLRLKRLCEIGVASGVPWMYSNPDCVFPSFPGDQRCGDEAPDAAP